MINIQRIKGIKETYSLIKKLASISGPDISDGLIDRTMYHIEKLPPLGKEYWWFIFFSEEGEKPVQLMLMICRTYGKKMIFNDKEMELSNLGNDKFKAVTTGWVCDDKELRELGDTNAITEIKDNKITSELSGQKVVLKGNFPNYKLEIGDIVDLDLKKSDYLHTKEGFGGFFPPLGLGWINIYCNVEGTVLGKGFKGRGHLQKVFGVTLMGPFHWLRLHFKNGSVARFFCFKPNKKSKRYFKESFDFYDHEKKRIIDFGKIDLNISKKGNQWIVTGKSKDKTKKFKAVLDVYGHRKFNMKGDGSLVYNEYAITPAEFILKTKEEEIVLDDLGGGGVGTFEDTYWKE